MHTLSLTSHVETAILTNKVGDMTNNVGFITKEVGV
jgi:hypothetical protein